MSLLTDARALVVRTHSLSGGSRQVSRAKRLYMSVRLRDLGFTYGQISRVFWVTPDYIRQIVTGREPLIRRHDGIVCACQQLDCCHDESEPWSAGSRCSVCGGPVKRNSKTGICTRTRECTNEHSRVTSVRYLRRPEQAKPDALFGQRLRALRAAKGWSRQRLAKRAMLSSRTVEILESNRTRYSGETAEPRVQVPQWSTVRRLADALECSIEELTGPPRPETGWIPVKGVTRKQAPGARTA